MTTVPASDKVQNLSFYITVYSVALLLNLASYFYKSQICLSIKISDTNLNFMCITFHMGGGEETFCDVSQMHGGVV